ncbi:GIY-YIG nuclease family protein [Rhodohalobacter sp. 8-1]|uniref:GIY-YIG nuclease family protein n=1 Tax=Rhodohalobacter sp. 8-1 TaxID=3131972 RepID=UPI0030ED7B28
MKEHNIPLEKVLNAKGLKKREYRSKMKELKKSIAFNVTPCQKKGHTLRNRSGHCVQCNTAYIAYQKRNDSKGIVYIAESIGGGIIKVGYSKSFETRSESLNRTEYAGYSDWVIKFAIESKNAGRIEHKINSSLKKYAQSVRYNHDNHLQESTEIFKCAYHIAKKELIRTCETDKLKYKIVNKFS